MRVYGDYRADGHALVRGMFDQRVVNSFLTDIKRELARDGVLIGSGGDFAPVLTRPAFEVYGPNYTPMRFLLSGLTPIMEKLVGALLLPSYSYFRLYRKGDVCRIHSDRAACEHSMTLTLSYSDDKLWAFQVGNEIDGPSRPISDDFQGLPFSTVDMKAGDAVIYRGIDVRHGRADPNPNVWSAHMFLHWVEKGGRYSDAAFEYGSSTERTNFEFVDEV